jgi:hypothetical protein
MFLRFPALSGQWSVVGGQFMSAKAESENLADLPHDKFIPGPKAWAAPELTTAH